MLVAERVDADRPKLRERLERGELAARVLGPWEASAVSLIGFWGTLAAVCGLRAFVGLYGTRIYSHDAFMVLDGAWRMVNGQRPHVDFNSMIGPMAYLPCAVGLLLSGHTVAGFGYGLALAGFGVGAWAFVLGGCLAPRLRSCFALLAECVTLAPAMVGPSPFNISPGMTYNRLTYGLLSLVLLECWEAEGGWEFWRGVSTGVVLVLLAFTKMTGVVIGLGMVAALGFVVPKARRRWVGVIVGAAVAGVPFLAYLHFRVGAVLRDLGITAAAKHVDLADRYDLNAIVFEAAMAVAVWFAIGTWLRLSGRQKAATRLGWAAAVTLGASVLLIFGNFQRSELPLMTFLVLLGLNEVAAYGGVRRHEALLEVGVVAGAMYVVTAVCALVFCFTFATYARIHTVRGATRFATPALRSFVPVGHDYYFVYHVNDGLELLEQNRRAGERVMSLDFVNPFSLGLQIPPAPGGSTNLQYRGSFDDTHRMPAEELFGHAELVMEPVKGDDPDLTTAMARIYGPYLHSHYSLVGETAVWRLYRRNRA